MFEEGNWVRVVPRDESPPSMKYGWMEGQVMMRVQGTYGPTLFVQIDGKKVETAFEERDLSELNGHRTDVPGEDRRGFARSGSSSMKL